MTKLDTHTKHELTVKCDLNKAYYAVAGVIVITKDHLE